MLRYTTGRARPGLVALYTTYGQETERANSYNPEARTGRKMRKATAYGKPFRHNTGVRQRDRQTSSQPVIFY